MKFPLSTILRFSVASVLTLLLLLYLGRSVTKFIRGGIGTVGGEEEVTAFQFPSVSVCGSMPKFRPLAEVEPWISVVTHDMVEEGGNGSNVYVCTVVRPSSQCCQRVPKGVNLISLKLEARKYYTVQK